MSTLDPTPRRYTDEEMRHLLERATELQAQTPADAGLTLAELEDVAREAGIDVAALRRAAGELEGLPTSPPRGRTAGLVGGPLSLRLERTLPVEASPEALDALTPLLQASSDAPGTARMGGRALAWRARSAQNTIELNVLVTVRDGETRIRIEERYESVAALIYGVGLGGIGAGVGFGVGVGVGVAIGSVAMAIAFPVACLGATFLGSRALYGATVRRRTAVLESLMDTLAGELVATPSAERALPTPPAALPAPGAEEPAGEG
jgi:hypothetical protein